MMVIFCKFIEIYGESRHFVITFFPWHRSAVVFTTVQPHLASVELRS